MTDVTLAEFLLARVAEDEADAVQLARDLTRWEHEQAINGPDGTQGGIIAAQLDPARVLAECEAKRGVIAELMRLHVRAGDAELGPNDDPIFRLLAAPYADHPDYREEWKP